MEIILLDTVQGLGKPGDVVLVIEGYARNFLFPQKLALVSTLENKKVFETKIKKLQKHQETEKKQAQDKAEKISQASCTITVKVGDDEKLFGTVTAADIASSLKDAGIDIDKRQVELKDPVKSLGVYQVEIKLHPEVTANAKVWVVKE